MVLISLREEECIVMSRCQSKEHIEKEYLGCATARMTFIQERWVKLLLNLIISANEFSNVLTLFSCDAMSLAFLRPSLQSLRSPKHLKLAKWTLLEIELKDVSNALTFYKKKVIEF